MKSRSTIRGFEDQDEEFLNTYAGSTQRYAQRILHTVAAQIKLNMCVANISKVFLKGVTHRELHEAIGEPLREVN